MAFTDYDYRDGSGYYKKTDMSGPYWLDDAGTGTLMTTMVAVPGASAAGSGYVYRDGAGWFKEATGAGPYAAS